MLNSLHTALMTSPRSQAVLDNPDWFLVGSQAFRTSSQAFSLPSAAYIVRQGFYVGLKACLSGLVVVCDMTAACFLNGGRLLDVIASSARVDVDSVRLGRFDQASMASILKDCKVLLTHSHHRRKFKSFGPPANSEQSRFVHEGRRMTVAEYFGSILSKPLQYPAALTINVSANKAKPIWIPLEFVAVIAGQCRTQAISGRDAAQMIKYAAVRPHERFNTILSADSILTTIRSDETVRAFGVNDIALQPLSVPAKILPAPKLLFGGNQVHEPKLTGQWPFESFRFLSSPREVTIFGVLLITSRGLQDCDRKIRDFTQSLINAGAALQCRLQSTELYRRSDLNPASIEREMRSFTSKVNLVVVLLENKDAYGTVKRVADHFGRASQCVKWDNIEKPIHKNLMLKINTKMGGVNHSLAHILPPGRSLPWFCDNRVMFVGIDVSHPERGSTQPSIAAVVASMDARDPLHYAAVISSQTSREEMVQGLADAIVKLLTLYKAIHGEIPSRMIVYRDGVSDGQFAILLDAELRSIHEALALMGYLPEAMKITIIVCQKGHHTRFFYEDPSDRSHINPCPGLIVEDVITSPLLNEFYLNSHVAIQGTAKPCKYTIIYDDSFLNLAEVSTLTYALTYLYCRANKSVSYPAPAYYAHWASKRGGSLQAAGASAADLVHISNIWLDDQHRSTSMFFV